MNGEQIWDVQVETLRGGFVESRSRVSVVAVTPTGKVVMRGGNAALPVFWRSAAKFVQALGLYQSGAAAKFGFGTQELALACASHSGGPEHVAVAARMLELLGLTAADLRCGVHVPLGEPEARALASHGTVPHGAAQQLLWQACGHAGDLLDQRLAASRLQPPAPSLAAADPGRPVPGQ